MGGARGGAAFRAGGGRRARSAKSGPFRGRQFEGKQTARIRSEGHRRRRRGRNDGRLRQVLQVIHDRVRLVVVPQSGRWRASAGVVLLVSMPALLARLNAIPMATPEDVIAHSKVQKDLGLQEQ